MSVIAQGIGAGVGATVGTAIGGPVGTIIGGAVGAGAEALIDGVGDLLEDLFSGKSEAAKQKEIEKASALHKQWLEEVIQGAETYADFRSWVLWNFVLGRDKGKAWPRGMASDGTRHSFLYARRQEWRKAADRLIAERPELQKQFEGERAKVLGTGGGGSGSMALPLALLGLLALSRM